VKNKHTGDKGETIAANFLQKKGFEILERNWRHKHLEIDIIATIENKLHFVEVKTRTNTKFGLPEESISKTKMNHLKVAAEAYLLLNPKWENIQFDVIAIMLTKEKEEIFLIEDVFF
jgi:putative endonuclease